MKKNKIISLLTAITALAILVFASQGYAACKVGDKIHVSWQGEWYPVTVLKTKGDQCYIHYVGYGSDWDEWVSPNRIKTEISSAPSKEKSGLFGEGDAVFVEWKGGWYPAHIIGIKPNSWKIHYDEYDSSWDEWVERRRIRFERSDRVLDKNP